MTLRSRVDLNLLNVFEAIYSRSSVTAAAHQLNLSQSAVSHALARLRREFDDPLFVRSGNTLVPTTLARSIVEPVRSAIRGINAAVANAGRFDPASSDRLFRIGLRPSLESNLFETLVVRIARDAPHLRIASMDFRRGRLVQMLADADLDLAIDIPSSATETLHALPLMSDRLLIVARHGHPTIEGQIDLDTYLSSDHILVSPRPGAPGAEDDALAALGARRRVTIQCQHASTAWGIVTRSDVILTLRESSALALLALGRLQVLPLPFDVPVRSLNMLWHDAAHRDPGHVWLRGIAAEVLRQPEGHAPNS